MVNYNTKKKAIHFLLSRGVEILEIDLGDASLFFSVRSFEPPIGGSVSSATYLQFFAIDITEFLEGDVLSGSDTESYFRRFEDRFRETKYLNFQFSENHTWRFYKS